MTKEFAVSSTSRRLGEYLDCEPEAVEAALAIQRHPMPDQERRRFGELLLELKAVELEELLAGIQLQRVDRLRACPLFKALSREELTDLSAVFQEVSIEAGEQFITQDDKDPTVFVLASGILKVFRVDDVDEEIPLARVFPGEPVGEMGYFADGVRSASVRTLEPCQLLRAGYDDLSDCFESVPGVASAFLDVVTHRLRKTNLLYQENQFQRAHERTALDHLSEFLDPDKPRELEAGVDELLVRLVHTASRLTDADRASLFLVDPETGELWSKVAQGAEIREIRVPPGAGIVGWVVAHNEMLNVGEAYEDDRFNREVDRRTGYRTHTILCTPVRDADHHPVGAVQVINKNIGVFNEDDESFIRAFAEQAAIGIENINRFRGVLEDQHRLAVLLEVATAVSRATDPGSLTKDLSARLSELMRCEHAYVMMLDAQAGELWCLAPEAEGDVRLTLHKDRSAAGRSAETGETFNVRDAYEDNLFDQGWDEGRGVVTRNLLCAPVVGTSGSVMAVIECINRFDGVFEEEDEELLKAVAAQLGVSRLVGG